jgi:hypothetical protein
LLSILLLAPIEYHHNPQNNKGDRIVFYPFFGKESFSGDKRIYDKTDGHYDYSQHQYHKSSNYPIKYHVLSHFFLLPGSPAHVLYYGLLKRAPLRKAITFSGS